MDIQNVYFEIYKVKQVRQDKLFNKIIKQIQKQICKYCQNFINAEYINTLVNHPQIYAFIVMYDNNLKKNIKSFAFIKKVGYTFILDLICAKYQGKLLMNFLESMACSLNIRRIKLFALPHVINYYRKLGYRHIKRGCKEKAHITEQAEKVQDLIFKEKAEFYKNLEFMQFLRFLIKNNMTAFPCNMPFFEDDDEEEDLKELIIKEWENWKSFYPNQNKPLKISYCNTYGYYMTKCLPCKKYNLRVSKNISIIPDILHYNVNWYAMRQISPGVTRSKAIKSKR